jgi:hypothetical protein
MDEKAEFQGHFPPQRDVCEDRHVHQISKTGHKNKDKDLIILLGLTSILLRHHSKQQFSTALTALSTGRLPFLVAHTLR